MGQILLVVNCKIKTTIDAVNFWFLVNAHIGDIQNNHMNTYMHVQCLNVLTTFPLSVSLALSSNLRRRIM